MLTPCPKCQSEDLTIRVVQYSEQKVSLDGPHDGDYDYDITHEDVIETRYYSSQCRACDHRWSLEHSRRKTPEAQPDTSSNPEVFLAFYHPRGVSKHWSGPNGCHQDCPVCVSGESASEEDDEALEEQRDVCVVGMCPNNATCPRWLYCSTHACDCSESEES